MKPLVSLVLAVAASNLLLAQDEANPRRFGSNIPTRDDPPLLMPEERQAVEAEAAALSRAITPSLADAAKSTVRVWSGARRVAYGTIVGDGRQILTKWSELARTGGNLRVDVAGSEYRSVKPVGAYPDDDLILLEVEGAPLTPVKWSTEVPKLGAFLAAPQPDGKLAAFGVVSVLERNLRDTDYAYLGVKSDPTFPGPGVKVTSVEENTGAFAAGLKPGNVILKVGERSLSGLLALKNALAGVTPGSKISLLVASGKTTKPMEVTLGNRPKLPQFSGARLQQMEQMGGDISEVRDGFTHAIQTDMRPRPNQVGGPVVDLKGNVIGITMARADRTRSFIMPAAAVQALLKTPAGDPAVAKVRSAREDEVPAMTARAMPRGGRPQPGNEQRMRRHLNYMQRLMDQMREEMDGIGDR